MERKFINISEKDLLLKIEKNLGFNIITLQKVNFFLKNEWDSFSNKEYFLKALKSKDTDFENVKKELNDVDDFKMLAIILLLSVDTYKNYLALEIDEKIFFDTFKCLKRFIDESYIVRGKYVFDRYYWLPREISLKLFRIGELEYEMLEENKDISIHIPSDAIFKIDHIKSSIKEAKVFFNRYFKEYKDSRYICESYLMEPKLYLFLKEDSNIIQFQNLFNIIRTFEDDSYKLWIFKTLSDDIKTYREDTSLQRELKKYLLEGNKFGAGVGVLK